MQFGHSNGTLESFKPTESGGNTIVFGEVSPRKAATLGVGSLGAALCIWLFLYVSSIFPYLGHSSRSETLGPGVSLNAGTSQFGTQRMLLFEGQRAFFDYKIRASEGGAVRFDVHPYPFGAFSDQSQVIEGDASGTVEFIVPKTGVYKFYHDFSLNGISGTTQYSVSWGAR